MKKLIKFYAAIAILFGLGSTLQAQCFEMGMNRTDYPDKVCFEMEVTFERGTGLALTGGVTLSDNTGNQRVCHFNTTTTTWCYDKHPTFSRLIRIECESQEREVTMPNGNIVQAGCAQLDGCIIIIEPL